VPSEFSQMLDREQAEPFGLHLELQSNVA